MNNILSTLGLFVLTFIYKAQSVLAIDIDDFEDQVFRPDNLPTLSEQSSSAEGTINTITLNLVEIILFASGSIAVLILVIGGVRYIASFGNQEAMDEAKKTIKFAIIGLVVIILAYAIVTNVINILYSAAT